MQSCGPFLPAPFRAAYGDSAEQLPPCRILAYLFENDDDLSQLLDDFIVDAKSKAACVSALRILRDRALPQAQRLQKRCAIIPAERQLLELLQKKPLPRLQCRGQPANGCGRNPAPSDAITCGLQGGQRSIRS